MAAMSDYLENRLIDHVFRGVAYTAPTNIYIGLFTATPSDSGGGTEVSGGSYARSPAIACTTTAWASTGGATTTTNPSAGTSGTTSNNAAVTWAVAPTANWGVVTSIGAFDASTGGNLLFYGALTTSKTINSGDAAPSFAISALTFTIDN
jgi:hypothetical protein